MFGSYFEKLEKKLLKKYKPKKSVKKATTKKTTKKAAKNNYSDICDVISSIVPIKFNVSSNNIVDTSGVIAKTSDYIISQNKYPDMENIFSEGVPSELVSSAGFVVPTVNRKNLEDVIKRVSEVKKIDQYVEEQEEPGFISTFVMSFDSTYTIKELKESTMEYYKSHGIEGNMEFEVMAILGQGLLMKDWRNAKNYIALETGDDTLKWYFILMNEYLEMEKSKELDLRSYIKSSVHYNEY